ncbi:MAG: AAA family ATPase [Candidatus Aenigmarchaeota archaeon]|nr:AAA family ATPase [Candidatus Aenigmarchaeota archaeon]NIP40309.1 AAA family ATPase [Candidatus Aenigmarchaeota archaeon]NIQ17801.1 AAA family ATPase [Candidatus Aenigmarchaeota archaeon]NIS73184.1 AAA family ATPase [Candidatus Aenigmarchaeota archaeon]
MVLLVLGITGRRGCGKDTVAQYLSKKYGFRVLTFTDDVLAPMLKSMGKGVTRENLIELGMDMRKTFGGNAALVPALCERIGREGLWVVSGVRFREEVEYFRYNFGENFRLVSVECSAKKRFERLKKRGTKGEKGMSYQEFEKIEKEPTEKPINGVMKMARFSLNNNRTESDLHKEIDKLCRKLKIN